MAKKPGVLTVISGFSGVGKGTLVKELLSRFPENYALSISATTRKPREGEQTGREYFFITKPEFKKMIENQDLLEFAEYNGNFYGTPKPYVLKQLRNGKNVILEIEVQGACKIKEQFPDALLLFVVPPTADTLVKRLTGRGTETPEEIKNRMTRAIEECDYMVHYDEVCVNDDLSTCVNDMHEKIHSGVRSHTDLNALSERLKADLTALKKEDFNVTSVI